MERDTLVPALYGLLLLIELYSSNSEGLFTFSMCVKVLWMAAFSIESKIEAGASGYWEAIKCLLKS